MCDSREGKVSAESNIKYRLTGASVLIAVSVIFLPLLLDGQKKNKVLDSKIPEKPISGEIILVNLDDKATGQTVDGTSLKPDNSKITENETKTTEISDTQKKQSVIEKEPIVKSIPKQKIVETILEANKVPDPRQDRPHFKTSAFVIQLGSFSNKENAQKLVAKLKSSGYKAYLKVAKSNGKDIHRVLVGPILKRKQAEAKIDALNKLSTLKAIILVYDPLRH